jgi:hypothetical protein
MKLVVIGCLCAVALTVVGCADGSGGPTSPTASPAVSRFAPTALDDEGTARLAVNPSLSASLRSGDLHVTKECSGYTGGPGSYCMIKSSNVQAIEVDSKILYLQPAQLATPLGSDVVLDPPGPGNNTAFGHCSLALGVCTFSGGTGKFTGFHASVDVSPSPDFSLWYWEGTYSFNPKD